MPESGASASGVAAQIKMAATANTIARTISIAIISRRRSDRSVITPAGSANKNHGARRATGINAIYIGSRLRSEAIHAQTTTAIPSARLVKPLAKINRLSWLLCPEVFISELHGQNDHCRALYYRYLLSCTLTSEQQKY